MNETCVRFHIALSQVPHHTANSWNSHWTRDPLADRLLMAARKRATRGQGSTGNGEIEEDDVDDDQETAEEESSLDSDKDEAATSELGRFFGAAEMRTMAKYIARYNPDDWAMMTRKQRWLPYHLEVILLDEHMKASLTRNLLFSILIVLKLHITRSIVAWSTVCAL
jgi:hypothetical protein